MVILREISEYPNIREHKFRKQVNEESSEVWEDENERTLRG